MKIPSRRCIVGNVSPRWGSSAPSPSEVSGPDTPVADSAPEWDGESMYEVGMGAPEEGLGEMLQELLDTAKLNFFNVKAKSEEDRDRRDAAYADYEDFGSDNVEEGLRSYRRHAKLGMKRFMEQNLKGAIEGSWLISSFFYLKRKRAE